MRRHLALATMFLGLTATATASDIVEIEETWSFTVGQPDGTKSAPQVTTTMGPHNTTTGLHFTFSLNHINSPDFTPGGMQVQVWNDEQLLSYRTGSKLGVLSHANETVRWTQRMTAENNGVTFEIVDGVSATWGNFGGGGLLKATIPGVANLNQYRPYLSLKESGVGFGGNRVSSFQLERIKWTMSSGEEYQLLAPIDIDADLDP